MGKNWSKSKKYCIRGALILGIVSLIVNGTIYTLCSIRGIAGD